MKLGLKQIGRLMDEEADNRILNEQLMLQMQRLNPLHGANKAADRRYV